MERLSYEQSFALVDTKLALGYLTVAIAGFLFYMDKKIPFKDSYYLVAGAVLVYFLLSTVLYFFTSGSQYKNNKYVGHKGEQKIAVYGWTTGYEPVYNLKIVLNDKFDSPVEKQVPFTSMFDGFGYLNEEEVTKIIKELLEKKSQ